MTQYLRSFIPAGGALPKEVWLQRHRFLVGLTWFHALIIALLGPLLGYTWEFSADALFKDGTISHILLESFIIAVFAAMANWRRIAPTLQSIFVALGLTSSSAILVHLSGGYIELHFHFFVMIVFLAFYQEWIPFGVAIAYVALHHGLIGVLWPEKVYNHTAAFEAPWTWAGIHAFFVLWASAGCVIAWRYNEKAYARAARSAKETESALERIRVLNAGLENEIAEHGRARAEIAAKNRDLETLLYVTSHDLREPLRAIENFSRIIHDRYKERLDEKGQDFLRRVIQGAQRLNRLLDDILTLSRSQRIGPPAEVVDGEVIVLEALKRLEAKISATNARIRVAKNFDGLRVDRVWATQAIYNLVANALKFTRNGDPPEVEIEPYRANGSSSHVAGITVRDRGPGIPKEHAERIFQLFQRAVGRDVEGTGAGLAIVRQIAERHGGSAWVEPREGGGSEFIITFSQS